MLRSMISALVLVAVGSGLASGGDDADRVATKLQGQWVGTALEVNGEKAPEEDAKAFRMTITSDEIILMTCKGDRCIERKKKYTLDTSKSPMWINLTTLDGQEKGTTQLSIFSLGKDELKLCTAAFPKASAERPTEFKTIAGDGMLVVVVRRVPSK